MKIELLTNYNQEVADRIRELLIQLSRSGKDRGEIPESWFNDIISSPWHDLIVAKNEADQIIGIVTVSVLMGPGIRKNAYLEDFVTDQSVRGQGVGDQIWQFALDWAREKGCKNLEFTCGQGRESAQKFYKKHGAEIYDTNFFRKSLQ